MIRQIDWNVNILNLSKTGHVKQCRQCMRHWQPSYRSAAIAGNAASHDRLLWQYK